MVRETRTARARASTATTSRAPRVAAWLIAILIGFAPAAHLEGPLLRDPWTVHDDARQVVYQARLATRDAAAAADPNAHQSALYVPTALAFVYRVLGRWVDPLTLTKILPLLASPAFTLLVFSAGARRWGTAAGLAAAALAGLHSWSRWPPQWGAGDAGDLLALLQIGALACLDSGRPLGAAALVVAAAHLYPPAFLILGATAGMVALAGCIQRARPHGESERAREPHAFAFRVTGAGWTLAGGIALGAALLLAKSLAYRGGEMGRLFTLAEARSMIEFSPLGRSPLFFDDSWRSVSNDRSGLALDLPTLFLLGFAIAVALLAGPRRAGPSFALGAMTASGLVLWIAARELIFLYQPVRFVVVTLPLAAALLGGANGVRALERISRPALRGSAAALAAVGVLLVFVPRLYASHVTASPPALYRALAATPPGTLFAGPPRLLDFVPAFAERRVLVSDEMMPPMFVRRYATVRTLMTAMLTAYTARSPAEVDRFCTEHGVTHWIVDLDDFDARSTWSYFPPFDAIVTEARRRGPPYALAEAARAHVLEGAEPYAIVPCPLAPLALSRSTDP